MRLKKMIKIFRQLTSSTIADEPWTAELRNEIANFLLELIGKKLGYERPKKEK